MTIDFPQLTQDKVANRTQEPIFSFAQQSPVQKFGNSQKKKQKQPSPVVGKPAPCPIIVEKTSSASKISKFNVFLLSKDTRSDDSNSTACKFCFNSIMNLAKASTLGLGYIILMVLTILVRLGARLWQSVFCWMTLRLAIPFGHLINQIWNVPSQIHSPFWHQHCFGFGFWGVGSLLPCYESADSSIQNHTSLASLAAHNLAHSNKIFHQFVDFIVQYQLNPGHLA